MSYMSKSVIQREICPPRLQKRVVVQEIYAKL